MKLSLIKTLSFIFLAISCAGVTWDVLAVVRQYLMLAELSSSSLLARELGQQLWLHLATLVGLIGAGAATLLLWREQLRRRVDILVEACHSMALGEASPLTDLPFGFGDLNRLALAIQVMREALVDYLSLYRRFYDTAPDMFLSLAPAGTRVLDANTAFCRAVGRLKAEVIGQNASLFLTLDKGWEEALAGGGELFSGTIKGERGPVKVEVSLSLERGPEGQPWVLGAILRDVTLRDSLHEELMRKSAALERALEEIKSVDELKDQFLTTLSHELKTPLVSLKGFLQLMLKGLASQEDMQSYLDICWRNLGKLEKQINNLLDLARLSQSKEQFEMSPVDLAALVRMEAENLVPTAAERRVTLQVTQTPGLSYNIRGNTEKLIQLLDNLLLNAIKYNKEGGQVSVALDRVNGNVTLKVADSGVGMAREQMANIFNRFYRADLSGTGRIEGLGIGLSLVQEIVKLHGGDIQVESEPGNGTTFTVTLEATT